MRVASLCASALLSAAATHGAAAPLASRQVAEPIRGVNLGGLFVLEPWITPSLFEPWAAAPNSPVVDEWTYCAVLGRDECQSRLRAHWRSWVQESDVSALAALGINTLRIPIGYWALAPDRSEPYVQGQIPYLERVLDWAARRGMRVILDLHGAPGSQNGFDNSGRRGDIGWTKRGGDIPRTLSALRALARIAARHPAVVAVEALNEPANWGVPKAAIAQFYTQAYDIIKSAAPATTVVFHDAFLPDSEWANLVPQNLTDSILDTHIYHVFDEGTLGLSAPAHAAKACADGRSIRRFNARTRTICGEFSLATTDCARWLNGFQRGARWDGTFQRTRPVLPGATCAGQEDMGTWSAVKRAEVRQFAMAQLQAYEAGSGWIFWNFKTESADSWNYIKLAQNGIIPSPPVGSAFGMCLA
ncbi:hypothetical protein H4R18_002635 [Coemansia javaensis]|uniref:glucan 1,3-beta-glucosidase n=1 Tax=Coemansia javaensis TaxID=2761396 RepID=A0A9W8HH04_9FUNG|nr:hypothetical protein H4R18_002635 [Coemansia javaensis]